MKIYLGLDSFTVAAELVSCCGLDSARRVVTCEIKRRTFRVTPETAGELAFWAGVLSRLSKIDIPVEEQQRILNDMSPERVGELASVISRSWSQVRPAVTRASETP